MSDFAQSVKQQVDIVKIVEGYIRLRKAGATNYSGLCPFHKEKSPSFNVHAVRQFFHCFGCGVSGDVFTFVSRIENVTFPEAVRIVAQKAGGGSAALDAHRQELIDLVIRETSGRTAASQKSVALPVGTLRCCDVRLRWRQHARVCRRVSCLPARKGSRRTATRPARFAEIRAGTAPIGTHLAGCVGLPDFDRSDRCNA